MALSEFELIRHYFAQASARSQRSDVVLGIGDDCAILAPQAGDELAVSVDTLVAGVHFPEQANPYDIAYRSLAVNLSDLAAMGAQPAWFTLALTLPEANRQWLGSFSQGLSDVANRFDIALVGGDTTRGHLTISIQVIGSVPEGQAMRRDGANCGDGIYVTGFIGDAAAGLEQVKVGKPRGYLAQRFSRPQPRVSLAQALRQVATAAIDISDGLLADLTHILERSEVGAKVALEHLPLSDQLIDECGLEMARKLALRGGDDYELCFCAGAGQSAEIEAISRDLGVPITSIGEIVSQPGLRLYDAAGEVVAAPEKAGYQHF